MPPKTLAMFPIPSLINQLGRLEAARELLGMATRLLPQIASADSARTISSQIETLQRDVVTLIDVIERSIDGFEDRITTIGQFLLLNRHFMRSEDIAKVQRLLATIRGDGPTD
jgi:hypothetical protein